MMYDPDTPMPNRMLSIGPPKHAEKPMIGAKTYRILNIILTEKEKLHTATLIFATRSASELPIAKIVNPIMASERPKIRPNVCFFKVSFCLPYLIEFDLPEEH